MVYSFFSFIFFVDEENTGDVCFSGEYMLDNVGVFVYICLWI